MTIPIKIPDINIPNVSADIGLQQSLANKKNAEAFLRQYPDVSNYLKKNKLKKTVANIASATNALIAQKRQELLPKGRDISGISSDAARLVVYGECIIGGTITFIDSRNNNQYLDIIVSLVGHEIDSVQKVILDEYEVVFNSGSSGWAKTLRHRITGALVTSPTDFIFFQPTMGADNQFAIGDLIGQNPGKWTWDHKQSGVAHAYIILVWNAEIFGDGLPDFSFQVRGKKVYDPRTATNRYTATADLIIADYLTNTRYGMGVSWDKINIDNLIAAANVDDELVPLQGGGNEYRYTINGYFEMGAQSHQAMLERMCAATGGTLNYSNGLWTFWPAKWRTPVIELTEDDLRGPVKMQTMVPRESIFNCVKGRFVDKNQRYIETDYPAVKNSTYQTLDGEEIVQSIDYPFVNSSPTCQRLGKLELERIRQGISLDVLFGLRAYQVQKGENVSLTIPRYGWSQKPFEVVDCDFLINENGSAPELLVSMTLRETAEGVFNWNYWEETTIDLAPNTNLPSPFATPQIIGLMATSGSADLYKRGDGTVAPRIKLTWTEIDDYFVTSGGFVETQYKLSSSPNWIDATRIPASSNLIYLTDVQDGVYYDLRVRAINAFERAGEWTTLVNYFVIGKTEKPQNVSALYAQVNNYGILLEWPNVGDLDLGNYEIREGSSWDTAVLIDKPKTNRLTIPIRATGTYNFKIKAVDTSLNESVSATNVTVVITAPSVVSGVATISGDSVLLDWDDAFGGSWATEDYTVTFGNVYATSTFIAKVKASQFTVKANWSGLRKFWVTPNDIYGNLGTPFSFDVNIVAPPAVSGLSAKVIDNNILLSWTNSLPGSLPIDYYQIRKGATFGASVLVGNTSANYSTYFEIVSGTYIYWIVPVDTAGNVGPETSVTALVDQPVDFTLLAEASLDLTDAHTLTNVYIENEGTLLLPVNKTETWEQHFQNNGEAPPNQFILQGSNQFILTGNALDHWDNPQDQIDAGYPFYIQPTPATAVYSQTHDIGALITGGALIRMDAVIENLSGSLTIAPTLSVSSDNSTWTDYVGVYSIFESDFRYVKLTLNASGGGTALSRIVSVGVNVSVKQKRDSGSVSVKSSELTGSQVNFNKTFFDIVGAPQVTPYEIIRASEQWGTGNRLSAGDHSDFEPANGDFTIAGWFKVQSMASYACLAQKWSTPTEREYILSVDVTASNQITFFVSADGNSVGAYVRATNLGAIPLNTWIFVACWHDAANDVIGIRVNKLAAQTTAFASGIFSGTRTGEFALGGRSDSSVDSINGQMKNWGVWKGRVLSGSDLDSLYDCGFQKYAELTSGIKTSMVGFWELGESSGTREDSHSSNHDLTVVGTVGSRILPLSAIADFTDTPNPTGFKAHVFTENQVRTSVNSSWYADGFTNIS